MMLSLIAASVAVMQGATLTQSAQPQTTVPRWKVGAGNALIWEGRPYIPVGLRIDGSPASIEAAKKSGVGDVLVEMPIDAAVWKATVTELEKAGLRYVLLVGVSAPAALGYVIDPEGYRIAGITAPLKTEVSIPGGQTALTVLASTRDSDIAKTERLAIREGKLALDVDAQSTLEHVLLVYPEMRDLGMPDYWEGFDAHRDTLLAAIKAIGRPAGLRGIVNPFGTLPSYPGTDRQFVPRGLAFRREYEAFLRKKYTSVMTALRSWSVATSDIESFEQLARLVPLWSSTRGVSRLWDPEENELYVCESRRSVVWKDIQEVIQTAGLRRYERLANSIRETADVPVVQDWAGWDGPYETQLRILDGVGMRVTGATPNELIDSASRSASSLLRWNRPGWLLATEVRLAGDPKAPNALKEALDDAASLGSRGWFVSARNDEERAAVAAQANRAPDPSLTQDSTAALFYPEAAMNPAATMRLSGGKWWLPSPAAGNRVDLGEGYAAYRYADPSNSYTALWSTSGPKRVRIRLADPKRAKVVSIDGVDPKVKVGKNTLEMDVGQNPVIISGTDQLPIPEDTIASIVADLNRFFAQYGQRMANFSEEQLYFRDSLLTYDRNAAAGYEALRLQYAKFTQRLGSTLWIEAETSKDHNFSAPRSVSGTSNGQVLSLRTRLASPARGYYAAFDVAAREEGPHTIWISARVPAEQLALVTVRIGDQVLRPILGPLSIYATGFGWYSFGEISLARTPIRIELFVDSPVGADLAFDTLVLTRKPFTPNGIKMPDAIDRSIKPADSKKGGGSSKLYR